MAREAGCQSGGGVYTAPEFVVGHLCTLLNPVVCSCTGYSF